MIRYFISDHRRGLYLSTVISYIGIDQISFFLTHCFVHFVLCVLFLTKMINNGMPKLIFQATKPIESLNSPPELSFGKVAPCKAIVSLLPCMGHLLWHG